MIVYFGTRHDGKSQMALDLSYKWERYLEMRHYFINYKNNMRNKKKLKRRHLCK